MARDELYSGLLDALTTVTFLGIQVAGGHAGGAVFLLLWGVPGTIVPSILSWAVLLLFVLLMIAESTTIQHRIRIGQSLLMVVALCAWNWSESVDGVAWVTALPCVACLTLRAKQVTTAWRRRSMPLNQ